MKEPIRTDTPIEVKMARALEDCAAGDHTIVRGTCLDCGKTYGTRCQHPAKLPCYHCGERFCPNEGCDPNHRENCREAMRP